MFLIIWYALVLSTEATNHRLELEAMDIQFNGEAYPVSSIDQIESGGNRLYLRSMKMPEILEIDEQGRLIRIIGRGGHGPGEWGSGGVQAIALFNSELWGVGTHSKTLNGFVDGRYKQEVFIDRVTLGRVTATSNVFAVSDQHIVIPSPFKTKFLAEIFDKNGKYQGQLGESLENDPGLLRENPVINDSLWIFHDGFWYGLFKFFPVINVFDQKFNHHAQWSIDHAWINTSLAHIMDGSPEHLNVPLFSDFKAFKGNLYLMCRGKLIQFSLTQKRVTAVAGFFGKGQNFGPVEGKPLTLQSFAFLEDGSLVLAHPLLLWEHDLWKVRTTFPL